MDILELGMVWFPEQPGGLDRYFAGLLPELARQGDRIRGLVAGSDAVTRDSDGLVRSVAPLHSALPKRFQGFRSAVKEEIATRCPDLVAIHFALFGRPCLPAVSRIPVVVHFQGPWAAECRAEGEGWLPVLLKKHLVELPVYRRADRLITLSQAFADILVRDYAISATRIRVVPGGFDPSQFNKAPDREEARRMMGWPTDRRILVCVRRLRSRMGLENLVSAVAALRKKHPDVLLCIAGKGPLASVLQKQIDEAGLSEHVRLLGFVPDAMLPVCYAAADLSVVPTVSLEGFGLIVVESMAAGTPALVTPVGALPEILAERFPQLVAANPSVDGIRNRLDELLSDPSALPDVAACREHAGRFGWDRVVGTLREVYQEAVEAKN